MAYLLDANVFIQAKNLHYGLDFCPAFWDWLVGANARGGSSASRKLGTSLNSWAAATNWQAGPMPKERRVLPAARRCGPSSLGQVSAWATGQTYEPAAISTFLQVADYWLVAHAKAHDCIVVTHEVPSDWSARSRSRMPALASELPA